MGNIYAVRRKYFTNQSNLPYEVFTNVERTTMNDKLQNLQEDIAFLKSLAEEGRAQPVLGGSIMVMAGVVFGAASIGHWAMATGLIQITTGWAYALLWLGATAVFMAGLAAMRSKLGGGLRTNNAKASGVAWAAVGWTIFSLAGAMAMVSWRANSTAPLLMFPSIILALYGLGWSVAAAMSRKRWIAVTAVGAYVSAVAIAYFSTSPSVFLIYAVCLVFLAIAPGIVLMRTAPKTA